MKMFVSVSFALKKRASAIRSVRVFQEHILKTLQSSSNSSTVDKQVCIRLCDTTLFLVKDSLVTVHAGAKEVWFPASYNETFHL